MPDANIIQEWGTHVLAAAGAAATAVLTLRRKYSQDSTAIVYDKANGDLLKTVLAERDLYMRELKEAHAKELVAVGRIAHVEGLMEACERERKVVDEKLFTMRLHMRKLTTMLIRLDPQTASLLEIGGAGDGIESDFTSTQSGMK